MPAPPSRRRFLAGAGSAAAAALAGCLGAGMPHDAVVAAEPAAEPDTERDGVTVVRYADLPPDERDIVDDALDDGVYHTCEVSSALRNFAGRTVQQTYLERDGDYYALYVRIEDAVYGYAADPPEGDFDCGWV